MADGKDVALVGGAALALFLILGKRRPRVSNAGTIDSLATCRVFIASDGSLSLNGKPTTLDRVTRAACATRVELAFSGAARAGRVEQVLEALQSRGFVVVANGLP